MVCKGIYEGREVVGLRLNFSKRYITLAPVATVVGLAFQLFDPDKLLGGDRTEYGITVALIPRNLPGLSIGRRHFGKVGFRVDDFLFELCGVREFLLRLAGQEEEKGNGEKNLFQHGFRVLRFLS